MQKRPGRRWPVRLNLVQQPQETRISRSFGIQNRTREISPFGVASRDVTIGAKFEPEAVPARQSRIRLVAADVLRPSGVEQRFRLHARKFLVVRQLSLAR